MSSRERTGRRDLTYSGWHREENFAALGLSRCEAWEVGAINIDWCEYCRYCGLPLALIEDQVSEHDPKAAPVMAQLATMAGLPAFSVSVVLDDTDCIASFRVRRVQPYDPQVIVMSPPDYARWLHGLRKRHDCPRKR
jgi:hypothetical protein